MDFIIFIISMGALIWGADFIIKESERIALHFNISEFIIGATLIALGTSLPEMAASISASIKGQSDMAVANVLGSNIMNISLVLGLVFLIASKITPGRDLFFKDSAWLLFPVIIFPLMILDGHLSRLDGFLLFAMMGAYVMFLMHSNKSEQVIEIDEELKKEKFNWTKTIALLLVGFVLVVIGADYAIESAANIAREFGISEWIIGLILIAFGTSLPELVVSIQAARQGKADMSIGNIIGSNMANTSVVLGSAAMTKPLVINLSSSSFDIFLMIGVTLMLVFITANKLYAKASGVMLLIVLAIFLQHALGV
ncbi:calcium/sodium antiporter [Hydrogenimonas thermophila]|uniref:calcium/sodium antiporter n=1 Tax=Hydrogenimonas thermophila TaxID=223786 RepID=UPI002936D8B5|nr:calcium/sodium antiporter [Hydrogenimonas thermophila]WOE69274.1 calcium/sodium antiporter [Hydrogenimonas thermophila]WOE71784.1 calcium/sodium antiporter [Hydrogenimonas thermophila]